LVLSFEESLLLILRLPDARSTVNFGETEGRPLFQSLVAFFYSRDCALFGKVDNFSFFQMIIQLLVALVTLMALSIAIFVGCGVHLLR
jgi:hypothetical protein